MDAIPLSTLPRAPARGDSIEDARIAMMKRNVAGRAFSHF